MSKSKTKTATTTHGTVEYETVECDSCENEVAKADAERFIIVHEMRGTRDWGDHTKYNVNDGTTGWICPYCSDNGPMSTPDRSPYEVFTAWLRWLGYADNTSVAMFRILITTLIVVWVVALAWAVIA